MFTRKLSRAAIAAALTLAGGALFAASADPAMALCKRGGPHCVPDTTPPKIGNPSPVKIPGDSFDGADDCQFFPGSRCGTAAKGANPSPVIKAPTGKIEVR